MRIDEHFHLCFINEETKAKGFYDFLHTLVEESDNSISDPNFCALLPLLLFNTDQMHIWCKVPLVILAGVRGGEKEK